MVRPPEKEAGQPPEMPKEGGRSFRQRFWSDSLNRNTGMQKDPTGRKFNPKEPEPYLKEKESPKINYTPFKQQTLRPQFNRPSQPPPMAPQDPPLMNGHGQPPIPPHMMQRNGEMPPEDPQKTEQMRQLPPRAVSAQGMYATQGRRFSDGGAAFEIQSEWVAPPEPQPVRQDHWQDMHRMPPPRPNSEMGLSFMANSRYQSYCTLPRPDMGLMSVAPGNGILIEEPRIQSRDIEQRVPTVMFEEPPPRPSRMEKVKVSSSAPYPVPEKVKSKPEKGLVNWPAVLKLSILTMVLGVIVFGLGVARLLLLSKWALGIELCFGLFVALTGLIGVVSARKRHYCTLVACYVMSAISCVLAVPPFVAGLMVTVPETFPMVKRADFVGETDEIGIDVLVSALCAVQVLIGIVMAGMGCCTAGEALNATEEKTITVAELGDRY